MAGVSPAVLRITRPLLTPTVSGPKFGTPALFEMKVTSYVAPAVGEDWNMYTTVVLDTALTTGVPGGSTMSMYAIARRGKNN